MNLQPNNTQNRIARHTGQQGARPPVRSQAGIEKSATDIYSTNNTEETLTRPMVQQGPPVNPPTGNIQPETKSKPTRQKWTVEENAELMWCYYHTILKPTQESTGKAMYTLWRQRNPGIRPNVTHNTLSNQKKSNRKTNDKDRA